MNFLTDEQLQEYVTKQVEEQTAFLKLEVSRALLQIETIKNEQLVLRQLLGEVGKALVPEQNRYWELRQAFQNANIPIRP